MTCVRTRPNEGPTGLFNVVVCTPITFYAKEHEINDLKCTFLGQIPVCPTFNCDFGNQFGAIIYSNLRGNNRDLRYFTGREPC